MIGVNVPRGIYTHIAGIDLVRDSATGEFLVLEDNVRTPSGVSYVLENRLVMTRMFPRAFQRQEVLPVHHYPVELFQILRAISPRSGDPVVVTLTPGAHNSAYFEHSFLAQQMGIELVESRDLIVDGDVVYMKTIRGLTRVDVIYRRVDDEFLDPIAFRPDSLLGVPGLMARVSRRQRRARQCDRQRHRRRQGDLRLRARDHQATTSARNRSCATSTPTSARGRRTSPTCSDHLDQLVVKAVGESGGYGMLMGPWATKSAIDEFRVRVRADPRNYIAQPVVPLSRVPSFDPANGRIVGRHVDLRPYCLYDGDKVIIVPGGLTRVALKPESMVVNSSQGGGSKDTWVLRGDT